MGRFEECEANWQIFPMLSMAQLREDCGLKKYLSTFEKPDLPRWRFSGNILTPAICEPGPVRANNK